jgi:hypothetical protein
MSDSGVAKPGEVGGRALSGLACWCFVPDCPKSKATEATKEPQPQTTSSQPHVTVHWWFVSQVASLVSDHPSPSPFTSSL